METIRHAPPNSIVFISDIDGGEPPEHLDNALVHYSGSCVSVGCFLEIDGTTEISLGGAAEFTLSSAFHLAFDGMIATPSRKLIISDLDTVGLIDADVLDQNSRVRIWVNDLAMPNRVIVGWG